MAYSNLLSLEKIIEQVLDHDRVSISPHEKKLIYSLDKCVISLQAFLEHFPEKASKNLEAKIRDVAAEAEDILESLLQEQMSNGHENNKSIDQLQKVSEGMDSITEEVVELKNSIKVKKGVLQLGDSIGAAESSQVADTGEMKMVGFDKDLIEIKDKLCGSASELQYIPIYGMGGIGKTTLARNAYDDQLIVESFPIRVWVTASQDYSEKRILLSLFDSMKELDPDRKKESMVEDDEWYSKMALKVHKTLSVRRFLIVLDDIWSTEVLDDVKYLFPNSNNGSRILLTTRLAEVATYDDSFIPLHEMRLMDADQSWNLLREKVFMHQDRVSQELESIGREIGRSCRGLPLAIVVIAGVLSTTSKNPNSWKKVARNISSSFLATADGQIEKILSLSYNHLPHHLRPCFLYMGAFPEDHEIKATDLIRLWIAESFVKPIVSKEFEDTAEEYLEDLVNRSLIVVTKRKPNGKIKHCSLHDTVREMCIKLSKEEKFLVHVKGDGAFKLLKSMKDWRRVSIFHSSLYSLANIYSSTIRTLIFFEDTLGSFGSFRSLRVLDMLTAKYQRLLLSDHFFELFHLRYLAFCMCNGIPKKISNLQYLQTLIIKETEDFSLPREIWNLKQLRHLISSSACLANTNADTPALENLQTLAVRNLTCSISMLSLIPNLRKLWITYSSRCGDLLFHNLVHLCRLETLHLELGYTWRDSGKPNLVVPSSLKKLTLVGWGKREPYLDIVGPFPNLEVLKLKEFNFTSQQMWRTSDEDFPELKYLLIEESDLRKWETESSHFPRLNSLLIHFCLGLSEIPDCIQEFPALELIELKLCKQSLAESAKLIQEEAQDNNGDAFQLSCIDCKRSEEELSSYARFQEEEEEALAMSDIRRSIILERMRHKFLTNDIKKSIVQERIQDLLAKTAALKFLYARTVPSTQ